MATREKKFETINYNGTDSYLRDELFKRNAYVPLDENNKLIRKHAVMLLREWEEDNKDRSSERKCKVIFHKSMNPSAGPYVFASVNEKNIQAPYEKEVIVPEYFLKECIDRAVTKSYSERRDEYGRTITEEHKVQVYPYTLVEYIEEPAEDIVEITAE